MLFLVAAAVHLALLTTHQHYPDSNIYPIIVVITLVLVIATSWETLYAQLGTTGTMAYAVGLALYLASMLSFLEVYAAIYDGELLGTVVVALAYLIAPLMVLGAPVLWGVDAGILRTIRRRVG